MVKLLYTSDLHGHKPFYERLFQKAADVDFVCIGGDLCPRGGSTLEEWVTFQREFLQNYLLPLCKKFKEEHPLKEIFLIMGNDDFRKNRDVLEQAEKDGILKFIHNKSLPLTDSLHIAGYGIVNTTPFRLKDWEKKDFEEAQDPQQMFEDIVVSEEQLTGTIETDLSKLAQQSNPTQTIYVMHAPPFDSNLDIITSRDHVGSKAIRQFIEEQKPPMTLHGHIHESPKMSGSWMDSIGDTISINVGSSYPEDKLNCVLIDLDKLENVQYEEV